VIDTLIAATAIRHGVTLVTRNTGDVESTGVPNHTRSLRSPNLPWIDELDGQIAELAR